jgi:hypothetical protein
MTGSGRRQWQEHRHDGPHGRDEVEQEGHHAEDQGEVDAQQGERDAGEEARQAGDEELRHQVGLDAALDVRPDARGRLAVGALPQQQEEGEDADEDGLGRDVEQLSDGALGHVGGPVGGILGNLVRIDAHALQGQLVIDLFGQLGDSFLVGREVVSQLGEGGHHQGAHEEHEPCRQDHREEHGDEVGDLEAVHEAVDDRREPHGQEQRQHEGDHDRLEVRQHRTQGEEHQGHEAGGDENEFAPLELHLRSFLRFQGDQPTRWSPGLEPAP